MPYLMSLFFLPLVSALLMGFLKGITRQQQQWLAFLLSLLPLAFLLGSYPHWLGAEERYPWFPFLSIEFSLKVDFLSLLFLYLTAIVTPISILSLNPGKINRPHYLYSLILFLQGLLIGFFTANDLVVFTVFWEAMLFPLYFIISIWGGVNRKNAAFKFIVYLIAGSSLMIIGLLALYYSAGLETFAIDQLSNDSMIYSPWVFAVFALAFAVKAPLFPFHGWLPDSYYEAPIPGSILLAGLLSKASIYGFLRVGIGLFPSHMIEWSSIFLWLAIIGVFYGGLVAWMQDDFKKVIAYSSFSHVNFILVGIFAWSQISQSGAVMQAFNHGITITALFLIVGWLYERVNTTDLNTFGGLARYFPQLCWITLFFVLSSIALPGLNNFIGEIMILWGLFISQPFPAALLASTVILSALYMLKWMQQIYFGRPSQLSFMYRDISKKEIAICLPLILIILGVGVYPAPIITKIKPSEHAIAIAPNERE